MSYQRAHEIILFWDAKLFHSGSNSGTPWHLKKGLSHALVGISRDSTAIPAREKPTPKCKSDQKPTKRERGRPQKGEVRPPKAKTRLERQAAGDMTLEQMLDDLPHMTAQRVTYLYECMDSAYDAVQIHDHSKKAWACQHY